MKLENNEIYALKQNTMSKLQDIDLEEWAEGSVEEAISNSVRKFGPNWLLERLRNALTADERRSLLKSELEHLNQNKNRENND